VRQWVWAQVTSTNLKREKILRTFSRRREKFSKYRGRGKKGRSGFLLAGVRNLFRLSVKMTEELESESFRSKREELPRRRGPYEERESRAMGGTRSIRTELGHREGGEDLLQNLRRDRFREGERRSLVGKD